MAVEIVASLTHIEGYVVLAEPLQNFPPLTLLGLMHEDNEASHLGLLSDLSHEISDVPKASAPEYAASLGGMEEHSFRMNVSADVLGSIVKTLGIDAPGLTASTQRGGNVDFAFTDVQQACASFIEAVNWLNRAEAAGRTNTAVLKSYADQKKGNSLFLVTEVLESTSIEVQNADTVANTLSGSAAGLTGPVDAKAQVQSSDSDTNVQKYVGVTPIVFGFKANEIVFDPENGWTGGRSDDEVARQLAMGGAKPSFFGRVTGTLGHLFHQH